MTEWKTKLDAHGRRLVDEPNGHVQFEALVRVCEPLNAIARKALIDAGTSIHTESGNILTAELRLGALKAVAELDFVIKIEISRPMFFEATD